MLGFILISNGKNGRGVKTYGVKYNKIHTMKDTFFSIIFAFYFCCVCAELEFYPDFRKPDPSVLKWENERSAEDYALEQFANYLQEEQRRLEIERRIQQEPDFTYTIPRVNLEESEFAVAPPDPRYYQETTTEDEDFLNNDFDQEEQQDQPQPVLHGHLTPQMQLQLQYQEYQQKLRQQEQQKIQQEIRQHQQNIHSQPSRQEPPAEIPVYPQYKLKFEPTLSEVEEEKTDDASATKGAQILQSPKSSKPVVLKTRTEANWGLSGLSKTHGPGGGEWRKQDLNNIVTGYHSDQAVDIKPVSSTLQDDTAGVYIIAVVAGISAAATVGLIAFAIGWYNLQKNVKNASDVEYPAYGVTGPNKDVSPTGDRRLAQSAQMYHYQHQKQQIIAMESRAAATVRHGSMSEAESDEENEEGDYTVYECPGLAPTGEMEVKNPLFQDDPTPASQQPSTKNEESSMPDQK